MVVNFTLVVVASVLIATGAYLLLERSLTRILVGVLLMSNGVNVLYLVAAGPAGRAPLIGLFEPDEMSDSLPMAMVLTAIVITLASTAFMLTMAYRSFQLHGHDEVQDDVEDAQIRRLAEADEASESFDESGDGTPDEVPGKDPAEEVGA
ncbi:Na(+)/H(+) antiporter subunit C [Enemella sp. A6]|uniref:Na(+)/H(+) antiporter subunit C n=1 Tax=Enemella sp. A6 TaxID=3440152 RepID=UPI003EC14A88